MSEQPFPSPALRPVRLQIGAQTIAGFESPGTGRPILLVHGNSSSSRIWQKQLQGALGAKFRVIAIDLPGHGASSPPPDPAQDYSGSGYARAIAASATELDLKEVGRLLGRADDPPARRDQRQITARERPPLRQVFPLLPDGDRPPEVHGQDVAVELEQGSL